MKYFIYGITLLVLLSCSVDSEALKSEVKPPVTVKPPVVNPSILDLDIDENTAISIGNQIIKTQVTVSKIETEVYAHDSKLLIHDGIGYCAYQGNDLSSSEGAKGQAVRLSIFDIKNPGERKIFDAFKADFTYNTLKTDPNLPCFTPVLFWTKDNTLRVLCKVYEGNIQKYYYRDFSPATQSFTDPQICMLKIASSNDLVNFELPNVKNQLYYLFGKNYQLSTDVMFIASEPVTTKTGSMVGLTVGRFTANWPTDQGTTLLLKTNDSGKTFECMGAPDARKIASGISSQFVEGAFDFVSDNEIRMIGRNGGGGILQCTSTDGGMTFDTPTTLNDQSDFNTRATKPNLLKIKDGFLTIWNNKENFGGYTNRTVLDIRYSKDQNILNSKLKIRIKNAYGCHYPSLFIYNNEYYLIYSTDSRRLNAYSTGEIAFVKLPL